MKQRFSYALAFVINSFTVNRLCKSRAVAVINPHRSDSPYPFRDLAGVGVVFKLICACESAISKERGEPESDGVRRAFRGFADLAAIGTIADVMPLTDENRMIVAYGLSQIEHTKRPGLAALLEAAQSGHGVKGADGQASAPKKRRVNAGYIGFGIAPKINAVGVKSEIVPSLMPK